MSTKQKLTNDGSVHKCGKADTHTDLNDAKTEEDETKSIKMAKMVHRKRQQTDRTPKMNGKSIKFEK